MDWWGPGSSFIEKDDEGGRLFGQSLGVLCGVLAGCLVVGVLSYAGALVGVLALPRMGGTPTSAPGLVKSAFL